MSSGVTTVQPDPRETGRFLRLLSPGASRGYLTRPYKGAMGMMSIFINILSLSDDIAARACQIAAASDTYFGVGLRAAKLEGGKRGGAKIPSNLAGVGG